MTGPEETQEVYGHEEQKKREGSSTVGHARGEMHGVSEGVWG